jgi:hypothetical protein
MAADWQPKPIYCPRRHGIECDTPNACAGGADCRFGPDPATQRRIFLFSSTLQNQPFEASRTLAQPPQPVVRRAARGQHRAVHQPLMIQPLQ